MRVSGAHCSPTRASGIRGLTCLKTLVYVFGRNKNQTLEIATQGVQFSGRRNKKLAEGVQEGGVTPPAFFGGRKNKEGHGVLTPRVQPLLDPSENGK